MPWDATGCHGVPWRRVEVNKPSSLCELKGTCSINFVMSEHERDFLANRPWRKCDSAQKTVGQALNRKLLGGGFRPSLTFVSTVFDPQELTEPSATAQEYFFPRLVREWSGDSAVLYLMVGDDGIYYWTDFTSSESGLSNQQMVNGIQSLIWVCLKVLKWVLSQHS